MKVKLFVFNMLAENTYVAYDDTKECIIIDPGCHSKVDRKELVNFISENELTVKRIIHTHLHFDHIFGTAFAEKTYGLKSEAHQADMPHTQKIRNRLLQFGLSRKIIKSPIIGNFLNDGDIIEFGNQNINVLHVPGHSQGGLAFYNDKAGVVFVGDSLFNGGIGRTDLEDGDYKQLISSIKNKLLTLPPETIVYTGHGSPTRIGFEKLYNSFLV